MVVSTALAAWLDSTYEYWRAPIRVHAPADSQICAFGVPISVTWDAVPEVYLVEISLSLDYGETYNTLTTSGAIWRTDPAWGMYTFVPSAPADSYACVVQVRGFNSYDFGYSSLFRTVPSSGVAQTPAVRLRPSPGTEPTQYYTLSGRASLTDAVESHTHAVSAFGVLVAERFGVEGSTVHILR
jgi:hypothetical protein